MERKRVNHSGKLRLRSFSDLDGRSTSARMAKQLRAAIANDLGGQDALSTMQQALVNNAALLGAMLEDIGAKFLAGEKADTAEFATLANSQRRLLADLGLHRKAKDITPDLKTYIRGKAA